MKILEKFKGVIVCPECKKSLKWGETLRCRGCGTEYPFRNGKPDFIKKEEQETNTESRSFFYTIKHYFIIKNPLLYNLITDFLGLNFFWRKSLRKFLKAFSSRSLVIDAGSGTRRFSSNILNIDAVSNSAVDVIADVTKLPFKDNSLDGIVSEMILEHLRDPKVFISEAHRALKTGGRIYLSTVFLYPYHDSPHDFYRWTETGLKEILGDFKIEKSGIYYGAMTALLTNFQSFLASIFSLGSARLKIFWFLFFWLLLWPLRFLDLILNLLPVTKDEAAGFYIIAKKT